jgi:DNA-binding LacI/PurR family transcriptional regulator
MTGKRPISERTRRRVLAAIDELTYEPHAGARALKSQRTRVVGLIVPFGHGVDTAGVLPFIETITSSAREQDHEVLVNTADEGSAGLRRLAGRQLCDAIVLMDIRGRGDERIAVAAALPLPVILVGVPDDPMGLNCVDLDFAQAAELAVGELAATGHERLIILGYPAEIIERDANYVRRFLGAADGAAQRHGLPCELITPIEPTRAAAEAAAARIGRLGAKTGVIVPQSQLVQPLLHALTARGVRPGRDLSVIGLCTDDAAESIEPPVTNVSLEPRDVSRRAMRSLFWLLEPTPVGPPPAIDLIPPRLTRRKTVLS